MGLPQAYSCGHGTIFWIGFDGFHSCGLPFPHFLGSRWEFSLADLFPMRTLSVASILCLPTLAGHLESETEHHSVVSNSLWPHGLYSTWNSPGQNPGVGSLSLPGDLPNPGIEPRSPKLHADSLPTEPQGSPAGHLRRWLNLSKLCYSVISHLFLFFLHL